MTKEQFMQIADSYWSINQGRKPEEGEPTAIITWSGHCDSMTVSVYYNGFDMYKEHNGESWYILLDKNNYTRETYFKVIAQLEFTAQLNREWREKHNKAKTETMGEVKKHYAESIAEITERYDRRIAEIEERLTCVGL